MGGCDIQRSKQYDSAFIGVLSITLLPSIDVLGIVGHFYAPRLGNDR